MLKMYIAVLDTAPDYMVPTLVAHAVLGAHLKFSEHPNFATIYHNWLTDSFRKVVVRVNEKEFSKISVAVMHYQAFESTICDSKPSCIVSVPVDEFTIPNVLKFAKLWKPNATPQ